jgi:hypothetical protein
MADSVWAPVVSAAIGALAALVGQPIMAMLAAHLQRRQKISDRLDDMRHAEFEEAKSARNEQLQLNIRLIKPQTRSSLEEILKDFSSFILKHPTYIQDAKSQELLKMFANERFIPEIKQFTDDGLNKAEEIRDVVAKIKAPEWKGKIKQTIPVAKMVGAWVETLG